MTPPAARSTTKVVRKVSWRRVGMLVTALAALGALLYLTLPLRFKNAAAAICAAAALLIIRAALFGGELIPIGRGLARGLRALSSFAGPEVQGGGRRPRRSKEE